MIDDGLTWSLQGRAHAGAMPVANPAPRTPPPWLQQLWTFRGVALYAGGRRAEFRRADGQCLDEDPRDCCGWHALAHAGSPLAGCIRLVPFADPDTVTDRLMGPAGVAAVLAEIGVRREQAVEVGRWVVSEAWRGTSLAMQLIAASWALSRRHGFAIALATVGTRDRQDVLLARAGLHYVRSVPPIDSAAYDDRLVFMYAVIDRPRPTFAALVDHMDALLPPLQPPAGALATQHAELSA